MYILKIADIVEAIMKVAVSIVTGVYQLVSLTYQVFMTLATSRPFSTVNYQSIINNIYLILGVIMLFVLAYNILNLVVDPDKNKGGKVVETLIKKVVSSLILIVFFPTIFNFAMDFSYSIVNSHVIDKFFSGETVSDTEYDSSLSVKQNGNMLAVNSFLSFFYPSIYESTGGTIDDVKNGTVTIIGESEINGEFQLVEDDGTTFTFKCKGGNKECTLSNVINYVYQTGRFGTFRAFAKNLTSYGDSDNAMEFQFLVSIAAGIFIAYCIVIFCFDVAVRTCKLLFYEIIAPICISCRIVPKTENIFKNWTKNTITTYLSLFTRLISLSLSMFLISSFSSASASLFPSLSDSFLVWSLAYIFTLMGIITFMMQAPKLIDEIFGLNTGGLGIKDRLKATRAFGGTAVGLGFGAAGLVGGMVAAKGNPLAGIRAAKQNFKTRNLSGIESEIQRKEAYDVARATGTSNSDLVRDYIRRKLGLASLQQKRDREIANITDVNDREGNKLSYQIKDIEELDASGQVVTRQKLCIVDGKGNVVNTRSDLNGYDANILGNNYANIKNAVETEAAANNWSQDQKNKELNSRLKTAQSSFASYRDSKLDELSTDYTQQCRVINQRASSQGWSNEKRNEALINAKKEYESKRSNAIETLNALDGVLFNESQSSSFAFDAKFDQMLKLETESEENAIKGFEDAIRKNNQNNSSNQVIAGYRKELDDRSESKLREGKGWAGEIHREKTFTYSIPVEVQHTDANGVVTTTTQQKDFSVEVAGNYSSIQVDLAEKLKDQNIPADVRRQMQSEVAKMLEEMKFEWQDAAVSGVDKDGNAVKTDNVAANAVQKIKDALSRGEFRETNGTIVQFKDDAGNVKSADSMSAHELAEEIKKNAGRIDGITKVENAKLNSQKGYHETKVKDNNEVRRLHDETQKAEKRTEGYQAISSSSKYVADHPDVTGGPGGKPGHK